MKKDQIRPKTTMENEIIIAVMIMYLLIAAALLLTHYLAHA